MEGLKFVTGELLPECGHVAGSYWYDKNGDEFMRHPDTISGGHVYSMVRQRYREEKNYLDKRNPSQNRDIWAYKRAEFWTFCAWLHYYDRDTPENLQLCRELMDYWDIDESIYLEMRDIAEAYKLITEKSDKKDLDESIAALIELG